jgi:hypothetical protein
LGNNVSLVSPLSVALPYPVPPSATGHVRRRFVKGEPLRAAEAILADLVESSTGTLDNLFADLLPPLPLADFLYRRIAEPLQESAAISGPEAIQRLINECGVEFRKNGIKNQTLAALHSGEVDREAATNPRRVREI